MHQSILWNLKALYNGADDPQLDRDLKAVYERAVDFVASFRGIINEESLTPQTLFVALRAYEKIHELASKPYQFAYLVHAQDMEDALGNRVFQKTRKKWNGISEMMAFFLPEINTLPQELLNAFAQHPDLSNYQYVLNCVIRRKPFALPLIEEEILRVRQASTRDVLGPLYDELLGSLTVKMCIHGKIREFTMDAVLASLYSKDRRVREEAYRGFLGQLGNRELIFRHSLNAVVSEIVHEANARGYPNPMHRMHMVNGLDQDLIDRMMGAVEGNYALFQKYFRLKARVLGIKRLQNTDIFAPLQKKQVRIPFQKAKEIILDALFHFHPRIYALASEIFDDGRIDAELRRGKIQGAFCKCFTSFQKPFISIGYTGSIRDLTTLAHELGHGIHQELSSRQTHLNFEAPPIMAEVASTFAELVVCQYVMRHPEFIPYHTAVLAAHIEGVFATVFRQNALTCFEHAVYKKEAEYPLPVEKICRTWLKANRKLFGDAVEMVPEYRWGWAHVSHFFKRPFYCYSYIFGNLVSIHLFQNYLKHGRDFADRIVDALSAGGSRAPLELLSGMGLEPKEKDFWEEPLQYIAALIDAFDPFAKKPS